MDGTGLFDVKVNDASLNVIPPHSRYTAMRKTTLPAFGPDVKQVQVTSPPIKWDAFVGILTSARMASRNRTDFLMCTNVTQGFPPFKPFLPPAAAAASNGLLNA
jgi:hypothetical protein